MTPRPRRAPFILCIVFLLAAATAARAADTAIDPGAALEKLAEQKFGPLSRAERLMVRGAAMRNLVWLGPSDDPANPANDVAHGDQWGPERTVRAEVIRWLAADAEAARYVHPSGPGFAGAKVAGEIDLSYLRVRTPLTMLGCFIPAGLDISNAHLQAIDLRRSSTGPINGDSSDVAGDVSLIMGKYGPISFFRAHLEGNLDLIGARVANPGGDSVLATEAEIEGDADFQQGFVTDGMVDFRLAKIGHSLSFNNARFEGSGDNGLDAERAVVAGIIYWVNVAHTPHTILDLEQARAEGIGDDAASWPAPGNLNVDGFVYESIVDGPMDAAARLGWLALQPSGYKPQPYQQLAKVLAADGNDGGATDVLIAQREAQRRLGGLGRIERAWNLVLQVTIGYGFRPLRALWWIAAFVLVGTALFAAGYRMRIVTPTDADAYRDFMESGNAPAHYPPFNAFVYSLENFLPVVDLHQGEYWRPNPCIDRITGGRDLAAGAFSARLLRWYLWVHILAGWTLTPLMFAGLSGLIRPGP